MAVRLSEVTEWQPIKEPPARSSGDTLEDAIASISIGDQEGASKRNDSAKNSVENEDAPPTPVAQTHNTISEAEGLWRPSPRVAGGAKGNSDTNNLCEEGVIAAQGNLQPTGKVVYILEANHRVSMTDARIGRYLIRGLLSMPCTSRTEEFAASSCSR